jgi:hypothetical protein
MTVLARQTAVAGRRHRTAGLALVAAVALAHHANSTETSFTGIEIVGAADSVRALVGGAVIVIVAKLTSATVDPARGQIAAGLAHRTIPAAAAAHAIVAGAACAVVADRARAAVDHEEAIEIVQASGHDEHQ